MKDLREKKDNAVFMIKGSNSSSIVLKNDTVTLDARKININNEQQVKDK